MPNASKTLISQRWEQKFQERVRETATKLGMSMTKLTVEALSVYLELADHETFRSMKQQERKRFLIKSFHQKVRETFGYDKKLELSLEGIERIGLIKDRVEQLLKNNPKKKFSTNDISDLLQIPQSTARSYVRELGKTESEDFVVVHGRPNQIFYKPN